MNVMTKTSKPVVTERIYPRREPNKGLFSNRSALKLCRFALWCAVNMIFWPLIRPVVKRLKLIDMVFVVYPGTKKDTNAYVPLWFQGVARRYFLFSVVGLITRGQGRKRGIIIAIAEDAAEFSAGELSGLMAKIQQMADATGADSIALAGRLPGIFLANHIPVDLPFRKGDQGTVFTVTETVRYVAERENISFSNTVGVLGVGFIGGKVLKRLRELGYQSLIGFDPRSKGPLNGSRITITSDLNLLPKCKMVVVLTAKGSDIADSVPYLQEGAIVVDDTHPQLPPEIVRQIRNRSGKVYKTALGLEGVNFIPSLPGYDKRWLPGCVIEALVNGQIQRTQDSFDLHGQELGLRPFLVSPKD